jgi:hypothetical protein
MDVRDEGRDDEDGNNEGTAMRASKYVNWKKSANQSEFGFRISGPISKDNKWTN